MIFTVWFCLAFRVADGGRCSLITQPKILEFPALFVVVTALFHQRSCRDHPYLESYGILCWHRASCGHSSCHPVMKTRACLCLPTGGAFSCCPQRHSRDAAAVGCILGACPSHNKAPHNHTKYLYGIAPGTPPLFDAVIHLKCILAYGGFKLLCKQTPTTEYSYSHLQYSSSNTITNNTRHAKCAQ